jgi:hypothetical protein
VLFEVNYRIPTPPGPTRKRSPNRTSPDCRLRSFTKSCGATRSGSTNSISTTERPAAKLRDRIRQA